MPPSHRPRPQQTPKPSRRLVLGLAGAGAVGLGGVRVSPSAAAAGPEGGTGTRIETMPRTLAKTASGPGAVTTSFPIGYVGVRWTGPHKGAAIRFLSAGEEGTYGPWQGLPPSCQAARDDLPHAADAHNVMVAAGADAAGYELRLPTSATDGTSVAVNTQSGPPVSFAVPAAPPAAFGLTYLSRASWGADESLRYDAATGAELWPPAFSPAQALTVHHTVSANDDPDPAATIRAIYHSHTVDRGFGDIGYHFLIDEAGLLYEGRYSGPDSLPGHDWKGQLVTAGHVRGYNVGNLGVALLGDFTNRTPTEAARRTLTFVLAGLARMHSLDPLGTVTYVNPVSGAIKDVSTVSGHRDWNETECPGAMLYPELDTLRADFAQLAG